MFPSRGRRPKTRLESHDERQQHHFLPGCSPLILVLQCCLAEFPMPPFVL